MKSYDICLCMGRFQPFHLGHFDLVQTALAQGERVVILLGSHLSPPSLKNPWNSKEREYMIWQCLSPSDQKRVQMRFICDCETDEQWAATIHREIESITSLGQKIAIVGHHNDSKKFFSQHFSAWGYIEKPRRTGINATDIRAAYFSRVLEADYQEKIPFCTLQFLMKFKQQPMYQQLCQEFNQLYQ